MAMIEVIRNAATITNISHFLELLRDARSKSPTGAVWLRGLPNEVYSLIPSIGREHSFAGKRITYDHELEQRMLRQFRRYAFEFFGRTLNEWEALFVARHHGLPVRLLDWTSDPLAALYFACEYNNSKELPNAKIWFLIPIDKRDQHIKVVDENKSPFEVKGIKLVYPMVVASRINAQSGLFTIHENPQKPLEELGENDYDETDLDIIRLTEFIISGAVRDHILKDLNDLRVTRGTLYPDLDGLSASILNSEIMRG